MEKYYIIGIVTDGKQPVHYISGTGDGKTYYTTDINEACDHTRLEARLKVAGGEGFVKAWFVHVEDGKIVYKRAARFSPPSTPEYSAAQAVEKYEQRQLQQLTDLTPEEIRERRNAMYGISRLYD